MNAMPVKTDVASIAQAHPIYGNVPIGRDNCTLEAQPIQMLNFWHEKAVSAAKNYSEAHPKMGDDDSGYDLLYNSKWQIFEAAFKTSVTDCTALAALLQIVNRRACDCGDVEVALDLEKLQIMARVSAAVTAPLSPKKRTGKLRRGNKLTAFGLIYRYQAFLIQELETIGWHVYGERDYPMMSRHYDDAVNARCRLSSGRGAYPIFFNPKSLPARARSVLKSLKIDTENAGGARPMKKGPLSPLTVHETIPPGCFLHPISDDRCAPYLTAGQFAVIDVGAKEPIDNGIFLIQFPSWQSERYRSIVQLSRSPGLLGRNYDIDGWWEKRPSPPVDLKKVKTYRTMAMAQAHVIDGGLSNGPMQVDGVRKRIVGRVVGKYLAPDVHMVPARRKRTETVRLGARDG